MTYSAREEAVRAEIEKQAPDLKCRYVTEMGPVVYAAFAWPSVGEPMLKGFTTTALSTFELDEKPPGLIAAQLIGGARYWYARSMMQQIGPPPNG